jgi:hypothetical protein
LFAGRLLVPDRLLQEFNPGNPREALFELARFARISRVSSEVAARRIADVRPTASFFLGEFRTNKHGEDVFQILWGANQTSFLRLTRARHLDRNDPLGEVLLSRARTRPGMGMGEFTVHPCGRGAAQWVGLSRTLLIGCILWHK